MDILSLFDGMSCGLIAFTKLGVPVDRYVAYEIDKYAIQTSKHNFPNVEQMGDVFEADFKQFEGFDMVIGGSPCTYWSIAQSADKREKTASGLGWDLFSQYVRAIHEAKPKFFIYENNKSMSKEIRMSITEIFGFEPICINSALVSAQNRQRLYWVGKRNPDGTYSKVDVKQPEDRGILLKDILDNATTWLNKSYTITATEYKDSSLQHSLEKHVRTRIAEPVGVSQRGRYVESGNRSSKCEGGTEQFVEARKDGKSNCLTTVQKDSMVAQPIRIGQYGNGGQGQRIYSVRGKSVTLSANGGGQGAKTGLYKIDLPDGDYTVRKLTISECKRLQTVPEWYEFPVSDSQAYKMLGNGWTVDVIMHLLSSILKEGTQNEIHGREVQTE